jgi:polysaccharide biosynthesis protein PslJ
MATAAAPAPHRSAAAESLLLAFGALALALALFAEVSVLGVAAGFCIGGAVAVRRPMIAWRHALVMLLIVILFVPIRRYRFPGDLPFQLEPYRLLVALLLVGWIASLLVDERVRLRASGFEVAIGLVLTSVVVSIAVNPDRFAESQSTVLKGLTFFISFVAIFYLVVSVVRSGEVVDVLVKTLVAGGALVGLLAVLEARAGITPFTRLHEVFPVLIPDPSFTGEIGRGGAIRAYGPAEHPIALGAALVMLVPLAIYAARTAGARWWVALGALVVGVLSTVSRTGIVMLVVVGIVYFVLRPRETRRLWPLLVPMLVATHFAVPGTLGSLRQSFFPEGGLIQQQRGSEGSCSSAGRVADLGPTLAEVAEKPFLGYGFGTRIVTGPDSNACILDNQWLGTLVEVGAVGTLAWLLLFVVVIRRFGQAAKHDDSPMGWLLVGVVAAVSAYAVGMFTFDALGFTQVSFLLFVLLGLGAATAELLRQRSMRPDVTTGANRKS